MLHVETVDRGVPERRARTPTAPQRAVLRSRIVLLLAEGLSAREVARRRAARVWRPFVGAQRVLGGAL